MRSRKKKNIHLINGFTWLWLGSLVYFFLIIKKLDQPSIFLYKVTVFRLASMTLFLLVVWVMRCSCISSSGNIHAIFSRFYFFNDFLCVIAIPFKKLFHTFFSKQKPILVFFLFLAGWRNLISIVITHQNIDWHKWRSNILFE